MFVLAKVFFFEINYMIVPSTYYHEATIALTFNLLFPVALKMKDLKFTFYSKLSK